VPRSNLSLRPTSTARLSRLLGYVSIGNRYDIARFYEAEFIFLSCDLEDLWAVCHESTHLVRASADRRTKALKRMSSTRTVIARPASIALKPTHLATGPIGNASFPSSLSVYVFILTPC
jgi:hypothetical protein